MHGLTYAKKPAHGGGEVATLTNQGGHIVARIMIDRHGATCTCVWPAEEGKCLHLLLMEREEGKRLMAEWPAGRQGKLWNWQV